MFMYDKREDILGQLKRDFFHLKFLRQTDMLAEIENWNSRVIKKKKKNAFVSF